MRAKKDQGHPSGITDADFKRLSEFVQVQCGVRLPPGKRTLLAEMIQERLRAHGRHSFKEYLDWLLGSGHPTEELIQFVDLATSAESEFFHQADHFEYLVQTALPELIKVTGAGISRDFMIWSAGCATGEEAYTLAMVLQEFADHYPGIPFRAKVLATDISERVLATANDAIYNIEKVAPISMEMKRKYLLKSRDPNRQLVRVIPELREMVKFRRLNILDHDFGLRERMDIIFCRNRISHFNRPTQQKLVSNFCRNLSPGGYLFLGHTEELNHLQLPVVQAAPSIYRLPLSA
ncbi:CheR family methyltransferase [Candidatus Magnetaquicoccus inordinatus]|uniref:CheR family methyltransferase n=1 Tax=Candidatus Magnetaquicoccus inordinatus TaxID=2496818 RepID=UPI00102AC1C6|nr:protein-glutamate O-methyltransferase CheR [Candidatus Magnetaquicoccus inordinatus]